MKIIQLFLVLALIVLLPNTSNANQQGFGVPKVTAYPTVRGVSRMGKVTGNDCRSDNDCIVGCAAGQPDDLKCLTTEEASNQCVSPDEAPNVDYPCACLPDVNRCGFVFSKNKVQEDPEQVMRLTQPAPPKMHPTPTRKSHHKKSAHSTKHKKKTTKPQPAASAAPTPITEPTHDSGQ